jgi:CheY-like chemotaxis protein
MKSIFAPFCSIVEARDGQEALVLVAKSPLPDLIITDVMMPNVSAGTVPGSGWLTLPQLDGFGLLSALKKDKRLSMVPVIML